MIGDPLNPLLKPRGRRGTLTHQHLEPLHQVREAPLKRNVSGEQLALGLLLGGGDREGHEVVRHLPRASEVLEVTGVVVPAVH